MGEALAPFRGQVVIATKFGFKPAFNGESRWSELDSRPEHIKHVAEAVLKRLQVEAVKLTPDDLCEIDSAASKITVQGARYPEQMEQMTDR